MFQITYEPPSSTLRYLTPRLLPFRKRFRLGFQCQHTLFLLHSLSIYIEKLQHQLYGFHHHGIDGSEERPFEHDPVHIQGSVAGINTQRLGIPK